MSKDISVQWFRGGFTASHLQSPDIIAMQLDNMNISEAAYYGGAQPYFRYSGYINTTLYPFQYQDGLQDVANIDPRTGVLTRYRVISDPEPFPDNHYELALDRMVGT